MYIKLFSYKSCDPKKYTNNFPAVRFASTSGLASEVSATYNINNKLLTKENKHK